MDNLRDVSLSHTEPITAGWYELSNTSNDKYPFVLKSANAEVILPSGHHEAKASVQNGIASVQTNFAEASMFEANVAEDGRFYFNIEGGERSDHRLQPDVPPVCEEAP